jgi:hypothetical protein
MEYKSTEEERYEKADIAGYRRLKSLEKTGEKWVIFGIVVEIAVAVVFAWRDDSHIREINSSTPSNMHVATASATAIILLENFSQPTNALQLIGGYSASLRLLGTNGIMDLTCGEQSWPFAHPPKLPLVLHFQWQSGEIIGFLSESNKTAGDLIRDLNFFNLNAPFLLSENANVLGGSITIVLNGEVSKTIPIPPQILGWDKTNSETGKVEPWPDINNVGYSYSYSGGVEQKK